MSQLCVTDVLSNKNNNEIKITKPKHRSYILVLVKSYIAMEIYVLKSSQNHKHKNQQTKNKTKITNKAHTKNNFKNIKHSIKLPLQFRSIFYLFVSVALICLVPYLRTIICILSCLII